MIRYSPETVFDQIDSFWQAELSRFTLGISPASLGQAFHAWQTQLLQAPGKTASIILYPFLHKHIFLKNLTYEKNYSCGNDPRFKSSNWNLWPWRLYLETFLMVEKWTQEATKNIPGLDDHSEQVMSFASKQIIDMLCPANFPFTNPDLMSHTIRTGGINLIKGAQNAIEDIQNYMLNRKPENAQFSVGKNLAITPGEVVFRNELIELIRYAPQTKTVYAEPILILPAWIMKYYILDLSSHNSLVNWLVKAGHTVFMVSWKNPKREDANLGMNDYYRLGAITAIEEVSKIFPKSKIHLTGYCLGGTLAMITAAAMAHKKNHLKTLSLFAAQGDFTEAGELMTFISQSSVSFLENMMRLQGYLDTKQMAGTFQMLRPYDLIWSKAMNDYLEGKRRDMIDLTTWNADATRMPYKMHSEYLEELFLHNKFSKGQFSIEGKVIAPENIQIPIFALGTEKDHVAPWKSVYKIHLMASSDITFVLANGGHNAGIVSEPGHKERFYKIGTRKYGTSYLAPEQWQEQAIYKEGSWWPAWHQWLVSHSTKRKITPPKATKTLGPAPGTYILQK